MTTAQTYLPLFLDFPVLLQKQLSEEIDGMFHSANQQYLLQK